MDRRSVLLLFLVGAVAFGLRFARLGDWSFSGDETTTIREEGVLFRGLEADPEGQLYKLPRVNPLGYLIHHLGYRAFGYDEWGARAASALFGGLQVVLLFLLSRGLLGTPSAFATSALVALWPQHLFASQDNRFYVIAAFFVSAALLFGAHAVKRRSPGWMGLAVGAAFLAILSHAVQGVVLGTLVAGVLAAAWAERRRPDGGVLAVIGGAVVVGILYLALYLVPLVKGWNQGSGWGYSTPHAILAAASSVGFPLALMVPVGALVLWSNRTPVGWYWLACAFSWVAVVLLLPNVVVYHPAYAFPLEVTAFVLAGALFGQIYEGLRARNGAAVAAVFIGLVVLVNAPGVVSHLKDGSRYDYRTIARHLTMVARPEDAVAARSPDLLRHYAPGLAEVKPIYADDEEEALETLVATSTRTWVVVHAGRSGLPGPITRFLGERCVPELDVQEKRYDYYDFRTALYLCRRGR